MQLPIIRQEQLDVRPLIFPPHERRFMNPGEWEVLAALMRSVSPKRVLEIGVNEGRTAKVLLDNVDGIEAYIGIDVFPGHVPAKAVQRHEVPKQAGHLAAGDPRFTLMLSNEGSQSVPAVCLPEFDAVFIDGDHGAHAVRADSALARSVIRPGGIVIWHDYHDLGTVDVRDVLDAMLGEGRKLSLVEGTWLAFERF